MSPWGAGKKTRQTEKEVIRQDQEMDRPGVLEIPEGSGEQRKNGGNGCEVIRCAPTTPHGSGIDEGVRLKGQ